MIKNQEHIDLYIKGLLKGDALIQFEKAMQDDAVFADYVQTQMAIVEGIKSVRHDQLKDFLKQELEKEPIVKPIFSTRIYWTVAASLAFLAIFYFTFKNNLLDKVQPIVQNTEIRENHDTAALASAEKDVDSLTPVPPPPTVQEFEGQHPEIVEEIESSETDYLDDVEGIPPVAEIKEAAADVEVKQDRLWAARYYPIKEHALTATKDKVAESDSELKKTPTSTKTEKNIPESGGDSKNEGPEVADVEKAQTTVKVEFWQSIVNFKGYSFSGILIKLYGIEGGATVSLHSIQEKVYLQWNNDFYYLPVSNTYNRYEKVTDESILEILRK